MKENTITEKSAHDVVTVISIAVLAYMLANVIHEGLGHGAVCSLVGGQFNLLSTVHADCGREGVSSFGSRLISAGGVVANFLAGIAFYGIWKILAKAEQRLRYFFSLAASVNLLTAGGYLLFLYPFGIGDGDSLAGLTWILRPLCAICGLLLYYFGMKVFAAGLEPFFIDCQGEKDWGSVLFLAKVSYWAGCIAVFLAGLRNPVGIKYVLGSALPATFFATMGVLKIAPILCRQQYSQNGESLVIRRSFFWICAAVVVYIIYFTVLGPGYKLSH